MWPTVYPYNNITPRSSSLDLEYVVNFFILDPKKLSPLSFPLFLDEFDELDKKHE